MPPWRIRATAAAWAGKAGAHAVTAAEASSGLTRTGREKVSSIVMAISRGPVPLQLVGDGGLYLADRAAVLGRVVQALRLVHLLAG
jgi:hypothetical protein